MATNEISLHTIDFQCYDKDNRMLGLATIDLPDFNFETVDVKGAGILGTYNSPVIGHVESMELTLHFRTLDNESLKYLQQHRGLEITAYNANQGYEASMGDLKVKQIRVAMRGLPKSLKAGKLEPSEQSETELTLELDYIKIQENGSTKLEFDKFNYKYTLNNVDYLAEVKEAVGLS